MEKPKGKVILLCGKVCAGKTTYSKILTELGNAVALSVDDIMLAFFPRPINSAYDLVYSVVQNYLHARAVDIVNAGVNVIFEGEAWTRNQRERHKAFFRNRGITIEMHYLSISDMTWFEHIKMRNAMKNDYDYFVDDELRNKCIDIFEIPEQSEYEIIIDMDKIDISEQCIL